MSSRSNITLKQLEALYWSATLGSFALAAERLGMTQSALSKRIAELEYEIDAPLFDRSGSRARPTEVAARIIPSAERMLNLCDEILVAGRGSQGLRGICRFGITQLMATIALPQIVGAVRSHYPEIVLEPRVALTQDLIEDVVRGETDFALAPGAPIEPIVASQHLRKITLVWVCTPELRARIGILGAETLRDHPVISMSPRAGSTTILNKWAMAHGLKFNQIVASNSPEAVAALTVAGLGISLLASPFVEPLVRAGQLAVLPVEPALRIPDLDYFVHWRKDNDRVLPKAVREIARSICGDGRG